jgi:hypothetical protein
MDKTTHPDPNIRYPIDGAWWNWPMDQIADNLDAISNGDLDALI